MLPKPERSQIVMLISSIVNGMFTLGIHCALAKLSQRNVEVFWHSKNLSSNFMHLLLFTLRMEMTAAGWLSGVIAASCQKMAMVCWEELLDWQGALLSPCKWTTGVAVHVHTVATAFIQESLFYHRHTCVYGFMKWFGSFIGIWDELHLLYTCCFPVTAAFP